MRRARTVTRRLYQTAVVLVGCSLVPRPVEAQEPAADTTHRVRERWALVGIWSPGLQRIGLLIPVTRHLAVRPDIRGVAWSYEGINDGWYANPGLSVIVRTSPTRDGWIYASLRAAYVVADDDGPDFAHRALTFTVGGHATLNRVLALFGETGVGYDYLEQGPGAHIQRTYDPVARFGFAVSRPPRR